MTRDGAPTNGLPHPPHSWLRAIRLAMLPGPSTPFLDEVMVRIAAAARRLGHEVPHAPTESTDGFLTTARYGEPVDWRQSLLFTGRRRFGLSTNPATYTAVAMEHAELHSLVAHFARVLRADSPDPADYAFPGLAERASAVLHEQGRRGGPMMCVARLLQAQTKSLRVLLVVGDDEVAYAYFMDLAGAFPRIAARSIDSFAAEVVTRIATHLSTREVADHEIIGPPVTAAEWGACATPRRMVDVSDMLGRRRFFTQLIRISDLVKVPAITDTIAGQYSEGCFATWEPRLGGLVATASGSERPIDKGKISADDLSLITAVRTGGAGAIVRAVESTRGALPSSEAVEFKLLDADLPEIDVSIPELGQATVPVVRSKLHGHRGVGSFDPAQVEFLPLDEPYYHYLVSCSTEAQAWAVRGAFGRARCLRNPDDPRRAAFAILPGHGLIMVEKWVPETAPFEVLLNLMESGALEVVDGVPQGPFGYERDGDHMVFTEETTSQPAIGSHGP